MHSDQRTKLLSSKLLASLFLFTLLFFIFYSCKKVDAEDPTQKELQTKSVSTAGSLSLSNDCDNTICEDCSFQEMIGEDTVDHPTVLGNLYTNPYSISAITQAYNNIHGTNLSSVSTTHYYVKFKPQNQSDLSVLDSLDVELYDYPLDREIIEEGEYWPDAYTNLSTNELPWLYTVVEAGFQFPSGINHVVLASLNIPDDDEELESEAFRITGNYNEFDCGSSQTQFGFEQGQGSSNEICEAQLCPDGYDWDYNTCSCIPSITCPPGYHWDGSNCVQDIPPPPPTFLHPQGMITFKTYNDFGVVPPSAPVKYTRVVGRRFFKIDKTYTDANGNFAFSKKFPRKVTIVVKFKLSSGAGKHFATQTANGLGLWKEWYPMRKNIGTYKGKDLRNLNYEFIRGSKSRNWTTRRWLGCIALNTAQEVNNFLSNNNLNPLDDKIEIELHHPNDQNSQPQYDFIYNSNTRLNGNKPYLLLDWITSDINSLTTSKVTINVSQQLGLAYLYKITSAQRLSEYNDSKSFTNSPFGNGIPALGYKPELIAIWQSFAQHLGHTIANNFFGYGQSNFELQGKTWNSSNGVSSSAKYLEQFDPSIQPPFERFPWIPVGLLNDLIDNAPDPSPVIDNVSGFSYLNIQTALQSNPAYMSDFKLSLKVIKPGQATAIDQLFASYGY